MRIDWIARTNRFALRRRAGAVAFEAVMILPVLAVLILTIRMLAEDFLLRADTRTDLRQAVVAMADTRVCSTDETNGVVRGGMKRDVHALCWTVQSERNPQLETRFRTAMEDAAGAENFLLSDVGLWMRSYIIEGQGNGTAQFEAPRYLHERQASRTTHRLIWPSYDTWRETNAPWNAGLDPALDQKFDSIGKISDLFPNLFPGSG